MADPRFFTRSGPLSLAQVAEIAEAEIVGCERDPSHVMISDVAPLDSAGPGDLSFIDNRKYVQAFTKTNAGFVLVNTALVDRAPEGAVSLVTKAPYRGYALVSQALYEGGQPQQSEISDAAHIDASATIGEGCQIGPGAVIQAGARVGAGCVIEPNAVIGKNVEIGDNTVVGATASLTHCVVGARVLIHPGARIGQRGFGFAMDPRGFVKVPQLGRVIIEDDVEIGANSTIDRGAGPDTVIGAGSMIDNLVQLGHNVRLGKGCVVVAQAGIAGSTQLGNYVVIAAQGGLTGHLSIGDGAKIAAQAGVMRDVDAGSVVGGSPAMDQRTWLRQMAMLAKLTEMEKARKRGEEEKP